MKIKHVTLTLLLILCSTLPAQADDVFLPMVNGGSNRLPLCTPEFVAAAENLPQEMIDRGELPSCQVPLTAVPLTDVGGIPGEVQTADINMTRKYSLYQTYCPTCSSTDGVTGISATLTSVEPYLATGNWDDYWYGNYISLGSSASQIQCQNNGNDPGPTTLPRIVVGVGRGKLTFNSTLSTTMLYFEVLRSNYCYGFFNYQTLAPQAGLHVEILREGSNSGWSVRYKIGNTWSYLAQNESMGFTPTATLISYGQEIGAYGVAHSNVIAPLNVATKVQIRPYGSTYKPYYETYLPAAMQSKTSLIANLPLKSLGVINAGLDYTSRGSTTQ